MPFFVPPSVAPGRTVHCFLFPPVDLRDAVFGGVGVEIQQVLDLRAAGEFTGDAVEMKKTIIEALGELSGMSAEDLRNQRYDKYRKMGAYITA